MVLRKDKNETGRPQRKPTEPEDVKRKVIRRRQSVTPAPLDDAQSSAKPPENPNNDDAYEQTMKALGTTDRRFVDGLLRQLVNASARGGGYDANSLSFTLALLRNTKPGNELEAMQVAQMAAVHAATMRLSGVLARTKYSPELDSAVRAMTQLARTYTIQLEALKRYRTGAEQKVTVTNVSVSDKGQAIVGNVTQAAPTTRSEEPANAPALTDARQLAMEILDAPEQVAVRLEPKTS
jgi:hypothetical protein